MPRESFFAGLKTQGISGVTVIGVAADYCVRWAIQGLVARGFGVNIPEELKRGIERQIRAVAEDDFAGMPVRVTPDA